MKNTLNDLNNYLFEALERLTDDSLPDDQLDKEIQRSDAITKVAATIIQNGELAYRTMKHLDEFYGTAQHAVPSMLEAKPS